MRPGAEAERPHAGEPGSVNERARGPHGPFSPSREVAEASPPRGECTLVIAGAAADELEAGREWSPEEIDAAIAMELAAGRSVKDVAAALAERTGQPKRALYARAVALRKGGRDEGEEAPE